MFAFSTCWNSARHKCGRAMIQEIRDFGFDFIELSHGMMVSKLPGILESYQAGEFRCSGVHNFFPSPVEVMIDAPDAYEYTSHRPHERQRAMELTLKTLETAARFEAKYVVLHLGSVPLKKGKYTKVLTRMVREGQQDTPEFTQLKLDFVKAREKIAPLYLQRAIDAVSQLAERARELGIILALESRSKFEDMPTEDEMERIQTHFKDEPAVAYWHDFGHVQLKHNLGLLDHEQWLQRMQPFLFGAHVHDVHWPERDHRVPFTGTLDFRHLLQYFPEKAPLVWELSPSRESDEIRQALEVWKLTFPHRSH